MQISANKAFQRAITVSHLLQKAQKLRHGNRAPEQRRYAAPTASRSDKNESRISGIARVPS